MISRTMSHRRSRIACCSMGGMNRSAGISWGSACIPYTVRMAIPSPPAMALRKSSTVVAVKFTLQVFVMAKRIAAMTGMSQHMACLLGQRFYGPACSHMPAMRRLFSNASYRSASDGRHGLNQVPGLRIAMESLGHFANSPGQMRSAFCNSAGNVR